MSSDEVEAERQLRVHALTALAEHQEEERRALIERQRPLYEAKKRRLIILLRDMLGDGWEVRYKARWDNAALPDQNEPGFIIGETIFVIISATDDPGVIQNAEMFASILQSATRERQASGVSTLHDLGNAYRNAGYSA